VVAAPCPCYPGFVQLNKLDGIACTGIAVTTKAAISVCFGLNLEAGGFIIVERAAEPVVFIRL